VGRIGVGLAGCPHPHPHEAEGRCGKPGSSVQSRAHAAFPGRRVGNLPTFGAGRGQIAHPTKLTPSLPSGASVVAMSFYRRLHLPGATYFFTVNLSRRRDDALVRHIDILRQAFRATTAEHPLRCDAMVVLPDHLHTVWTLPTGDADFSIRWRKIKARFTHWTGSAGPAAPSKQRKREVGLWQRRFWEHVIRDEEDFAAHVGYCHWNPVKHGLVAQAEDWPFSSVHRDMRAGVVLGPRPIAEPKSVGEA
jgi:putative transposase